MCIGQQTCRTSFKVPQIVQILCWTALFFPATAPLAATYTWDGGGTTNNWNDPVNWSNNTLAVYGADTAIAFGSGPRNNATQNIANPFVLNSLSFGNLVCWPRNALTNPVSSGTRRTHQFENAIPMIHLLRKESPSCLAIAQRLPPSC